MRRLSILFLFAFSCVAQDIPRSVTAHNFTHVVRWPPDFFLANSNAINAVVTGYSGGSTGQVYVASSIAALPSYAGPATNIYVLGSVTPGDGGGGMFIKAPARWVLSGATVNTGGAGYAATPPSFDRVVAGGTGTPATLTITGTSGGAVTHCYMTSGGPYTALPGVVGTYTTLVTLVPVGGETPATITVYPSGLGGMYFTHTDPGFWWERVWSGGDVNVQWFGARPDAGADGTTGTDNSTQFQAAIQFCKDANYLNPTSISTTKNIGATLYAPTGVYKLLTALRLDNGTNSLSGLAGDLTTFRFRGDGRHRTQLNCQAITGTGQSFFIPLGYGSYYTNSLDISGMRLLRSVSGASLLGYWAFNFTNTSACTFRDIAFSGWRATDIYSGTNGGGLKMNNCIITTIRDCYFDGNTTAMQFGSADYPYTDTSYANGVFIHNTAVSGNIATNFVVKVQDAYGGFLWDGGQFESNNSGASFRDSNRIIVRNLTTENNDGASLGALAPVYWVHNVLNFHLSDCYVRNTTANHIVVLLGENGNANSEASVVIKNNRLQCTIPPIVLGMSTDQKNIWLAGSADSGPQWVEILDNSFNWSVASAQDPFTVVSASGGFHVRQGGHDRWFDKNGTEQFALAFDHREIEGSAASGRLISRLVNAQCEVPSSVIACTNGATLIITNAHTRVVGDGAAIMLSDTVGIAQLVQTVSADYRTNYVDGLIATIEGTSDVNTVTITNTGYCASLPTPYTLGDGDILTLQWIIARKSWVLRSRNF